MTHTRAFAAFDQSSPMVPFAFERREPLARDVQLDVLFCGVCHIAGLIGGLRVTQEMLDFCAEHDIVSDIETIPMQKIDEAYERMLKSDVKYRFVIDLASLK